MKGPTGAQSFVVEVAAVRSREDRGLLPEGAGRGDAHLAEEGPRAGDVEWDLYASAPRRGGRPSLQVDGDDHGLSREAGVLGSLA